MQAGKLNKRIKVQQQDATRDSFGQSIDSWNTVRKCWASIKHLRGREVATTAEYVGKVFYDITVRWSLSFVFSCNHRIVHCNKLSGVDHVYVIESVINIDESNKTVSLLCYELDGDA